MVVEYKMVIYHGRIHKKLPSKQMKRPHSLQKTNKNIFSSRGMPTQTLHLPLVLRGGYTQILSHLEKKIPTFWGDSPPL